MGFSWEIFQGISKLLGNSSLSSPNCPNNNCPNNSSSSSSSSSSSLDDKDPEEYAKHQKRDEAVRLVNEVRDKNLRKKEEQRMKNRE